MTWGTIQKGPKSTGRMLVIATKAANQQNSISWETLFGLDKFEMSKSMYIISALPITY